MSVQATPVSEKSGPGSPWRRRARKLVGIALLAIAFTLSAAGLIYCDVTSGAGSLYRSPSAVPPRPVAIVFGAGYSPQGLSLILADRVRTAAALYKLGRVRKLLMTGDNSRPDYNEPEAMRQEAIRLGVPASDIVLDYAGFRTYDSLYRARDIFGVQKAVLVTQAYHLPRALYLARNLGLDAVGAAADLRVYPEQRHLSTRELFSVENAWFQANVFHPTPHFLGPKEPIHL